MLLEQEPTSQVLAVPQSAPETIHLQLQVPSPYQSPTVEDVDEKGYQPPMLPSQKPSSRSKRALETTACTLRNSKEFAQKQIPTPYQTVDLSIKTPLQITERQGLRKVGRNECCPCESGTKFKRCCGSGYCHHATSPLSIYHSQRVNNLTQGFTDVEEAGKEAYLSATTMPDPDILDNSEPGDQFDQVWLHRMTEQKTFFSATTQVENPLERLPEHYRRHEAVFAEGRDIPLPGFRGPGIDHAIELEEGAKLPYSRLYRQTERERREAKKYVDEMLRKGFIRPSQSQYASPLIFAEKKGTDELRPCVDYRPLNAVTKKNRHPLPLIDELIDKLQGAKYFTKLDLKEAFNLVRIRLGDEAKTAFVTQEGLYEYLVMPFGLCNAPASFQAFIERTLKGLIDTELIAYVDDILVFGNSVEQVKERTHRCLDRLAQADLFVKLKKCLFEATRVPFLGFIVDQEGIHIDPKRVDTIMEWKVPRSVREVQAFLGFCNFYRRFINGYSKVAFPLTDLTRKDRPFQWTEPANHAFELLKRSFSGYPMLRHFDPSLPVSIFTDASGFAIAGVLF